MRFLYCLFLLLLAAQTASAAYKACSSAYGCCTLNDLQHSPCKLGNGYTIDVLPDSNAGGYQLWLTDPGYFIDYYVRATLVPGASGCYSQRVDDSQNYDVEAFPAIFPIGGGEYTISDAVSAKNCNTQHHNCASDNLEWVAQVTPSDENCAGGPSIQWSFGSAALTACMAPDTVGSFVGKGGYHTYFKTKSMPGLEQFTVCPAADAALAEEREVIPAVPCSMGAEACASNNGQQRIGNNTYCCAGGSQPEFMAGQCSCAPAPTQPPVQPSTLSSIWPWDTTALAILIVMLLFIVAMLVGIILLYRAIRRLAWTEKYRGHANEMQESLTGMVPV